MTLVLSMNPFLDPEGDPPLSSYRPIWESERCTKTCVSSPAAPCSSDETFAQEPPCRRAPDHLSVSRVAYFKRKFVEDDEETPFSFRTYCQTVAPVLEERAHVLRLSLEKMRFIDDPEAFLRRSVLVNNLLRRLRAEIILQSSDWCFPPGPAFPPGPCVLPPNANAALHRAVPMRLCLAPQAGPPFRKRFRMLRGGGGGQGDPRPDCAQTCCCIYAAAAAAAAGHYLHLPFSVYDAALSSCPSTPHSSSFLQLAGHSKTGLTAAAGHDEEDEEEEEEEEENEDERVEEEEEEEEDDETRQAGPSVEVKDKSVQKSRTRSVMRTETSGLTAGVEEEQEEDEEEEEEEEQAQWDLTASDLHKVSFWHHKAHRQ